MKRFFSTREFQIPQGSVKVADKQSDAVAYLYAGHNGKPSARVFFGKQSKPVVACYYVNESQREAAVTHAFESRRKSLAFKAELRAKRTAWVNTYKVGDIFRTNWGYDQQRRILRAGRNPRQARHFPRTRSGQQGDRVYVRKLRSAPRSVLQASLRWRRSGPAHPAACCKSTASRSTTCAPLGWSRERMLQAFA